MTVERPWRLFVALPVPDHVRVLTQAATAPVREAAPDLTWTRPEGWHVTLAFLGEVAADRVEEVTETIGAAVTSGPHAPVACTLAGTDRFERRVLFLTVDDDPDGAVAALGATIQEALVAAHLPVQRRAVRPHLTLARASRRGAAVTDEVVAAVPTVRAGWEADQVVLVRSHVGGGPARYEDLATWPLREGR